MEYLNYAQILIGPAGSGKSTYCKIFQDAAIIYKRDIKVINLDPAAETFKYSVDVDIRELISVSDIMLKEKCGPNGALIYAMEYLLKNINWLEDKLSEFGENNYFLIDCPGQLELYSHYDIMTKIIKYLKSQMGFSLCTIFCLDCTFLQEQSKFISGCLLSLSSMIQISLPHLTIMTKCDLISKTDNYKRLQEGISTDELVNELQPFFGTKISKLNQVLSDFVKDYGLVNILTLNPNDEESVGDILYQADMLLQYYEGQEPKENDYEKAEGNLESMYEVKEDMDIDK